MRPNMKLVFVILNYCTHTETIECISSISDHIDTDDYRIVVVDNGSTDDSLNELQKKYRNDAKVHVIATNKNLGFAQGNNFGIKYANETYSPEFVVVLNSDIELFQDDLYRRLVTEYQHSRFGVWGPMMIIRSARCDDSPWIPMTLSQAQTQLAEYEAAYKRLKRLPYISYKIINRFASVFKKKELESHRHGDFWRYQADVELQGAFLVFSREVFRYIDGFDSRTFLYFEEQLLYLALKRMGMKMVYDPRYAVYHKDGVSTKKIKSSKQKLLFLLNCNIESLMVLVSEMKKDV